MRARRLFCAWVAVPALVTGLLAGPAHAAVTCDSGDPADCGALFDDFIYQSSSDATLAAHGWSVRTGAGAPGVGGAATWSAANVTFPVVDSAQSLQLKATTNGTDSGTTESEFYRTDEDSYAGTYLARIKFSDTPASGTDGDHLVQTFFAISSTVDCDPSYSETDFSEYLPNGGYGETRTFNSQTTWALAGDTCSDSVESDEYGSLAGWHTVLATLGSGHVRYYIDGTLVADHSGGYYPRRNMSIDFNQWLVDLSGHTGSATSTWNEAVDYVYYAENRVLTAAQAAAQVAAYRSAQTTFVDTVGAA
jgi:hypothetical protein